ncbi:Structural maintenance of chromosomes protein 6 [Loxospora ochrophaea]|nr:Structural maintenance of chromosomes protein 6 [Loxospora ochrophaea]
MPGLKRQRLAQDNGETEVLELEGAESAFRPDNRKRSRLSEEQHYEDEPLSAEDVTDEELEEAEATQFYTQQRKKAKMENRPAPNGIIETVTMVNFMCHAFLEIHLGPLINFIIGHNGSGKSAALTAITLCLGGKATATNRGGSLKSFIKEGQESCNLSIKIKNTDISAYQPEVYGDSIIVERHFSKAGTSGFKLKNSSGRLISTRKADLEDICDYFALQLDNPLSVLTQDMARQFLNSSNPSDKYKLFVKGVQLEQLHQDYNLIGENVDKLESTFSDWKESIASLEQKSRQARQLLEMSEKQDQLRRKIRSLANEMAWVQVQNKELQLETYDKDLRKADDEIRAAERKVEHISEKYEETDNAHGRAGEALQEVQKELEPLKDEKAQTKQRYDGFKAEGQEVQTEQRRIGEHVKGANSSIEKIKSEIADERRRLEELNGGSHTRRLAEIDQRKADVEAAKGRCDEHERNLSSLQENKRRAEADLKNIEEPLRTQRTRVQQCQEQLENLKRDRGQQNRGYPPNMPQLMKAIGLDTGFQDPPIGPVGRHVRLLKPLWSSILEKSFGQTLSAFIVTSKPDSDRLSAMMARIKCKCPIFIGSRNAFGAPIQEPDPEFTTTLRALEIDNDLVKRQLIIQQGIEQTILIESREEAVNAMDNHRLRNVKQCFTLHNASHGAGLRLAYGWGNALSSTFIPPYNGLPRMKTDTEYQINSQRGILQQLTTKSKELEDRKYSLQQALKSSNEAVVQHQRRSLDLRVAAQRAQTSVEALQDALEKDAVEEGRLDSLREQLQEAEGEKTTYEASAMESVTSLDGIRASMKETWEQMGAIDASMAEVDVRIRKANNKAQKLSNQRQTVLQDKNSAIKLVQDIQDKKREWENEREGKVREVNDYVEKASKICPRVPVGRDDTYESLEPKYEKLVRDLKRSEASLGGNHEAIAQNAVRTRLERDTAVKQFEREERLAQVSRFASTLRLGGTDLKGKLLKLTLVHRISRWEQFRSKITARARLQFQFLLSERGFRGRLTIDHEEKKLDLDVQPDETHKTSKGRQTQTLSGGEKSFSTICLLLALWEAMGAPIRCLDEFDVFMDSVNRDVSMRMMIVAARRSIGRQFVLITPGSMGSVNTEKDVKIHRMNDPERDGQTTISFPTS